MAMVWQKILANSVLGAVVGGVVGGVVLQNNDMTQKDVRRPDHGERLFENAQKNGRLLQLVMHLTVLRKNAKSKKDFDEMHRKMGRLLHLEENLGAMPKRANWTEVARFYSLDVRDACRKLVKHIVREMKDDKQAYPNAMELVDALKAVSTQAKDSSYNIEQNNLLSFSQ